LLLGVSPTKDRAGKGREITIAKGIGPARIGKVLRGSVCNDTIWKELSDLKASGDYQRIVVEVTDELERENREALKEAEAAEKTRVKAEQEAKAAEAARKVAEAKAEAEKDGAAKKRAEEAARRAAREAEEAKARQIVCTQTSSKHAGVLAQHAAINKFRAVEAATPITFDLAGCAKYFKGTEHRSAFRKLVTGPYKNNVTVEQQAAIAKKLVELVAAQTRRWDKDKIGPRPELTSKYIRDEIGSMIHEVRVLVRAQTAQEKEALRNKSLETKWDACQTEFRRACGRMWDAGHEMQKLSADWPKGLAVRITSEFMQSVEGAKEVIDQLYDKFVKGNIP
jgi:hypothetical protein